MQRAADATDATAAEQGGHGSCLTGCVMLDVVFVVVTVVFFGASIAYAAACDRL